MTTVPTVLSKDGALVLVVDRLRILGYAAFCVVVIVGIVLTHAFAGIDPQRTLFREVFGYNNVCVYFDHPPSSYVLPLLWAITLVLLLVYITAHWLQMRAEVRRGDLDRTLYGRLARAKLFEAFTLTAFSTSFAVTPEGWDHTLYIHTGAFFLLQLGLLSLAITNTVHGISSGYWRRLDLPAWFNTAAIAYCILFVLIVCFKIPVATNAMAGSPWWVQTDGFTEVARSVDAVFLVFAAVVPLLKAGYFSYFRADKIEVVHVASWITAAGAGS